MKKMYVTHATLSIFTDLNETSQKKKKKGKSEEKWL